MPVDKNQPFRQLVFDYHDNGIDFNSYNPETDGRMEAADLTAAWLLLTKLILRKAKDIAKAREALGNAVATVNPETGFSDYKE